jgi:hypothetical protein
MLAFGYLGRTVEARILMPLGARSVNASVFTRVEEHPKSLRYLPIKVAVS